MNEEKLLGDWKDEEITVSTFDEKAARKMINRTRWRMILWATGSVVGVLLLYSLYVKILTVSYIALDYQRQFDRYVTTVVESHFPGLRVEPNRGFGNATISPTLTQTTTMKLYRDVGNWQMFAGEVKAVQTSDGNLELELNRSTRYLNQNQDFQFSVPLDLIGSSYKPMKKSQDHALKVLEKIGDGHVAEMAVSTVKGMSARELVELLEKYDLRITELAVFSGELKEIKELNYGSADGDYFVFPLMMRPYQEYSDTHMVMEGAGSFDSREKVVERSEERFIQDLQWMLDNRGSYSGDHTDEQRLAYLQKAGIKVYGAIVTGPVRELEKLRTEENLRYFELGQVEFWNWHTQ